MEWIWLIFILFSIFAGLMEKVGKMGKKTTEAELRPKEPVYPENDAPVFAGQERGAVEVFGRPEIESAGIRGEKGLPAPAWNEEALNLGGPGQLESEFGVKRVADSAESEIRTEEKWAAQQLNDPEKLRSLLALAQVIKRPDFKTIPWQRRL